MNPIEIRRSRAFELMLEAIVILDDSQCTLSAIHLEWAIGLMPAPLDGTKRFQLPARNQLTPEALEHAIATAEDLTTK